MLCFFFCSRCKNNPPKPNGVWKKLKMIPIFYYLPEGSAEKFVAQPVPPTPKNLTNHQIFFFRSLSTGKYQYN